MNNIAKPNSSTVNISKVSIGETWATIDSTWATETRTWLGVSQLITNVPKANALIWLANLFPWQMATPWRADTEMTNISKP